MCSLVGRWLAGWLALCEPVRDVWTYGPAVILGQVVALQMLEPFSSFS